MMLLAIIEVGLAVGFLMGKIADSDSVSLSFGPFRLDINNSAKQIKDAEIIDDVL